MVSSRTDVAALVVEFADELGATLVRHAPDGSPAGDIWYGSAEEAQACAARDFGPALGAWISVPNDVADAAAYVQGSARRPGGNDDGADF